MPIELDETNIIIDNNSTTSNILEVIKSKGSYNEKAADGVTYSCGRGGNLGHGTEYTTYFTPTLIQYFTNNKITITQASGGNSHSIFLDTNGYVYTCGYGGRGQLGHGNENSKSTPTLIQTYIDSNGNNINYTNITIMQAYSSMQHSIFIDTNGYVYTCGYGGYGELGHGNQYQKERPTLISAYNINPAISDNVLALPIYNSVTDTLQKAAEVISGVEGWIRIKHMPSTTTHWYSGDDNFAGNYTLNNSTKLETEEWAISYTHIDWDEILFIKGNFDQWLRLNKSDLFVSASWSTQTSIESHNGISSTYKYFNDGRAYTPYIASNDSYDFNKILYKESADASSHISHFVSESYTYDVFIRKSTTNTSSVNTEQIHKYITFTYDPTRDTNGQTEYNVNFPADTLCDILIVGGGGGVPGDLGGGGGGGGLILLENHLLSHGTYNLKVGNGGKGGDVTVGSARENATDGYDSVFDTYTAIGGGRGGCTGKYNGATGGSGGGGSGGSFNAGGSGTANQGNNGGNGNSSYRSGGGGGAGGVGGANGGDGGIGIDLSNIFGQYVGDDGWFAGGGGGGYNNDESLAGSGGKGGGGNGTGRTIRRGFDGKPHTGGGGGGNANYNLGGAFGGSGVIIIRYAIANTNVTISQASGGNFHSIFLDTNGNVYSCGYGQYAPLGHGDTATYLTPTLIQNYIDLNGTSINYTNITISQISCSTNNITNSNHNIFLDTNGNVYSYGNNNVGQLGHGNTTNYSTPTLIQHFATNNIIISQVSAGLLEHSIFLATDGNVYSCGLGGWGQLGHGNYDDQYTPTLIQYFDINNISISQVNGGNYHSIFLATNGKVYSCGSSNWGQGGHGNSSFRITPTLIQFFDINNITILQVSGGGTISLFVSNDPYYQTIEYPAQWTYSDTDASVYHLGNVGIGTEASSTYSLNVVGDVNVNGDLYYNDAKANVGLLSNYVHDNDPVVYNNNIRILPIYNNRTDSLQKAAEEVSGVKGWRLVRFLPGTATAWHPVNDNLVGTTTYGTAYDYTNAFSVEFGDFDEFMFSSIGLKHWLHTTRDQAVGQNYSNSPRIIIQSSISKTSYTANWYNRSANTVDPWIGLRSHTTAPLGDPDNNGDLILYGENSATLYLHVLDIDADGGACVFVRNSTDTISSVATDYTHKYLFFNYNNYYESTFSYYTVHNINFPIDTQCDVLVVGGGGSGGPDQGGGGGAGGLVYLQNVTLKGDYSLVVGKGGAQTPYASNANNGYSSYFNKSRLTTYEDDNFEDYANGTIYGELNDISGNTYYITLSNGIKTRLTGWTHTRKYASGFLRNTSGYAYLTAYNLKPGETYDFATYSNNTTSSYHIDSYFNVNDGPTITVKQRLTKQPTYVGHAVADSNGEIIFKFWRSSTHIQFSGISISLNEGRYTGIYGGGGGRYSTSTSTYHGLDGGSGGGGANGHISGITATGGDSIQEEYLDSEGNKRGWGNPGGQGLLNSYSGGYVSAGGGGAGAAGGDVINTTTAGDGGDGKEVGITGIMTYYAGGGGGGSGNDSGAYGGEGGLGGGGHGGATSSLYVASSTINKYKDGLPHTGSGGGGVRNGSTNSGAGGSGVIIIRYAVGNKINTLSDWKYSSRFDDVYYMGSVAIGKNNASYAVELDGIPDASGFNIINVNGTITSTTKNFKIEHPIVSNMYLYHGCIEGPRFDNMYRGKKLVVNGYCEVDIDSECNSTGGMTPGTFKALNDDQQLYLQNNQTFDKVKGYIENGKIKIFCINTTENIMVDWLVIGERRDKDVINTTITNASGKLICEQ